MVRVRLTENQLRRLIYEELVDHYLLQKELWDDRSEPKRSAKATHPVNKGRSSA